MVEKIEKEKFKVSFQAMKSSIGGCIDESKLIIINSDREEELKISTLYHELSHYFLGHVGNRDFLSSSEKEIEAEFLSSVLCSMHNIGTDKSEKYLKNYLKEDKKLSNVIDLSIIIPAMEKIEKLLK
jgi:Zn-dependent peptidase ImmA (M78 family)